MRDLVLVLSDVAATAPWVAGGVLMLRTFLIHLRAHAIVQDVIADIRLRRTLRRMKRFGSGDKRIRKLIEDDHRRRSIGRR